MKTLSLLVICARFAVNAWAEETGGVQHGLKVSENQRYLVDAVSGRAVFVLADTAWNLGALKLDEIEDYLQSRAEHGFNTIMFALNFSPQADEKNAYGLAAYIGDDTFKGQPPFQMRL